MTADYRWDEVALRDTIAAEGFVLAINLDQPGFFRVLDDGFQKVAIVAATEHGFAAMTLVEPVSYFPVTNATTEQAFLDYLRVLAMASVPA